MSLYEISFIARQDFSKKQIEDITSNINNLIQKHKGFITKIEYCGLKPLAYPIKNNKRGYYVIIYIDTDETTIEDIKNSLRINEDLLRYLILSVEKHSTEHSLLYQQSKSFQEEQDLEESNNQDTKQPNNSKNQTTNFKE